MHAITSLPTFQQGMVSGFDCGFPIDETKSLTVLLTDMTTLSQEVIGCEADSPPGQIRDIMEKY